MAALTIAKTDPHGFGDETRYSVTFLGEMIGEVYKITESVDVSTGPSRIGRFVNRVYWHYETSGHRAHTLGYLTRRDAISALLQVRHYPGRPQVADRFARSAR